MVPGPPLQLLPRQAWQHSHSLFLAPGGTPQSPQVKAGLLCFCFPFVSPWACHSPPQQGEAGNTPTDPQGAFAV